MLQNKWWQDSAMSLIYREKERGRIISLSKKDNICIVDSDSKRKKHKEEKNPIFVMLNLIR